MTKVNQTSTWIRYAQNVKLSPAARGLLWYILSRPKIWDKLRPEPLAACNEIGIKQCRALLAELCAAGVLIPPVRVRQENGQFRYTGYRMAETGTRIPAGGAGVPYTAAESSTKTLPDTNTTTTESKTAADNINPPTAADPLASDFNDDASTGEWIPDGEGEDTRLEAAQDDEPATPPPGSAPPPAPELLTLKSQLAMFGVHEPQLTEIARTYPPDKIAAALRYTRSQPCTNPPGYFMDALRFGWYTAAPASDYSYTAPAPDGMSYATGKYADIIEH